jgi:hypothetical protein
MVKRRRTFGCRSQLGACQQSIISGEKKKRKERENKEREEENGADNQKSALNCGYCCHQHAKVAKMEHEESKRQKEKKETVKKMIDGPDHYIHCDEDPCVSNQD